MRVGFGKKYRWGGTNAGRQNVNNNNHPFAIKEGNRH